MERKKTRGQLVGADMEPKEQLGEEVGFTCASNATPLVISSNADVASGEKRSSPGDEHFTKQNMNERPIQCVKFQILELVFKLPLEELTLN